MDYYAGLDLSLEETSVCVVDGDGAENAMLDHIRASERLCRNRQFGV